MDFGFGRFLEMFEGRFGRTATTLLLGAIALAMFVWAGKIIFGAAKAVTEAAMPYLTETTEWRMSQPVVNNVSTVIALIATVVSAYSIFKIFKVGGWVFVISNRKRLVYLIGLIDYVSENNPLVSERTKKVLKEARREIFGDAIVAGVKGLPTSSLPFPAPQDTQERT